MEGTDKILALFKMAREDLQYQIMNEEYIKLETAFGDLTREMSSEEQDIAWGFICLAEQMNWRMLELICERFDLDPR